jgi:hypothetical protein
MAVPRDTHNNRTADDRYGERNPSAASAGSCWRKVLAMSILRANQTLPCR